ncbi:MAG: hypothetical protein WCD54_19275, partial [Pseudolabrys sp.]
DGTGAQRDEEKERKAAQLTICHDRLKLAEKWDANKRFSRGTDILPVGTTGILPVDDFRSVEQNRPQSGNSGCRWLDKYQQLA